MPDDERLRISAGGRLKAGREKKELDIESVSRSLHVPARAIEALEADDYQYFSAKVYAVGILRKYTQFLGVDGAETLKDEFSTEWDIRNYHVKRELTSLPENRGDAPLLTPRRVWVVGAILFLVILSLYIGFRVFSFVRNPAFTLTSPDTREIRHSGRLLSIVGTIERESSLTVNGREITIGETGEFRDAIELRPNLTILKFVAVNRFGKITRETRYVFVE